MVMDQSSLKISNIQSLQQEKQSNDSTIKIRTISEINQSHVAANHAAAKNITITKQHPSQQMFSKQIIVKKIPTNSQMASSPKPTITAPIFIPANGSPKVAKSPSQIPDLPSRSQGNFIMPPALEAYIKELEEENKTMKKMLIECRREAVAVQMRTHKLTNLINATLSKCNVKRPTLKLNHMLQSKPTLIPQQSPVIPQKQFQVIPRKSHNIANKGNVVCRVPVFPITRLGILKQLEIDLSKKEFSEYVFQKLYAVNNKADIEKPSVLLNNTLNSIIDPKLMGLFQYEESPEPTNHSECEYFKSLQRVRVLYGKLVNALSNTIFTKSVDMVALEKFVKNKISSHRNEYLASLERLKKTVDTLKTDEAPPVTVKTEKEDVDDKCVNFEKSQFRWVEENDEDDPMHMEQD